MSESEQRRDDGAWGPAQQLRATWEGHQTAFCEDCRPKLGRLTDELSDDVREVTEALRDYMDATRQAIARGDDQLAAARRDVRAFLEAIGVQLEGPDLGHVREGGGIWRHEDVMPLVRFVLDGAP